ncbi:5-formyltetrahydrofolate cyclo-ligase [soil metagenome]
MLKKELRDKYKKARLAISEKDRIINSDLILINFQKLELPFINCALTYLAAELLGEIDTSLILRYLEFKNPSLRIVVPRIDVKSEIFRAVEIKKNDVIVKNHFGVSEPTGGTIVHPQEIDLAIVPLLAFNTRGFRVGFGKGYFDKFLSLCKPEAIKIGLSDYEAEEEIDDINTFDIPLNFCITPQNIYSF